MLSYITLAGRIVHTRQPGMWVTSCMHKARKPVSRERSSHFGPALAHSLSLVLKHSSPVLSQMRIYDNFNPYIYSDHLMMDCLVELITFFTVLPPFFRHGPVPGTLHLSLSLQMQAA